MTRYREAVEQEAMKAVTDLDEHTQASEAALAKHTPGKWEYRPIHPHYGSRVIVSDGHPVVAYMPDPGAQGVGYIAEQQANASLIARSPELLAENTRLKAELQTLFVENCDNKQIAKAQIALREKAEASRDELLGALNDIAKGIMPPEIMRLVGEVPPDVLRGKFWEWSQERANAYIAKCSEAGGSNV